MSYLAGRLTLYQGVKKIKLGQAQECLRRKELLWPHQMQLEMPENLSPLQI